MDAISMNRSPWFQTMYARILTGTLKRTHMKLLCKRVRQYYRMSLVGEDSADAYDLIEALRAIKPHVSPEDLKSGLLTLRNEAFWKTGSVRKDKDGDERVELGARNIILRADSIQLFDISSTNADVYAPMYLVTSKEYGSFRYYKTAWQSTNEFEVWDVYVEPNRDYCTVGCPRID